MKTRKYIVNIRFSGGDEVRATVEAVSRKEAIKMVKESEQYKAFLLNHFGESIVEETIEPVRYKPKDNTITLTNAPDKEQWYYVDHHTAGIRLEFRKGKFNTHQNVWQLHGKGKADPMQCATALREVADWLQEHFPDMVTEPRRPRFIPKQEGADPTRMPSMHDKVNCFFRLHTRYADFIRDGARERGVSQGAFIELLIDGE